MKSKASSGRSLRTLTVPVPLALGLIATAHAAWTPVDNFNARPLGNINGQGTWVASSTTAAQVIVDPGNPINKVMHHVGDGDAAVLLPTTPSSTTIANGTTGTFFLRVRRLSSTNDNSFGLNDTGTANPGTPGNFESMAQVIGTTFRGRDGGAGVTPVPSPTLQTGSWYKVWIVANNAANNPDDTWKYYIQGDLDLNKTELVPPAAPWNFRNGTTAALIAAQFYGNTATGSLYFDDLYIDNTTENLTDPTFVADPDLDDDNLEDAWEVFYYGSKDTWDGTADTENGGAGDGLTNEEEETLGTNPTAADTDGDGLQDGPEDDGSANLYLPGARINPLDSDSDDDGASDSQEVNGTLNTAFGNGRSDPNNPDTDGDGFTDFAEAARYGTDPNEESSLPQLLTIIGPDIRNGSFELLGPVPGVVNPAKAEHWDTDADGDVPYWSLWISETAGTNLNSGTETGGVNTHGLKHAYMQVDNAAYNLSDHVVAEGDILGYSFDHTGAGWVVRGGLVYNSGTDEAPVISRFPVDQQAITETTSSAFANGRGNIYIVPAGSPAIGKKIGVGLKSTSAWPHVDKITLTLPAADVDDDGLADDWEDQYFGDDDGIPTPAELAIATGNGAGGGLTNNDADVFTNLEEQVAGSNPVNAASVPGDIDADNLDDSWELDYFVSLSHPNGDPGDDPDGDHDINSVEEANETNPNDRLSFYSSSGDTVPDSWKAFHNIAAQTGADDLDEGTGDGLINGLEFFHNTDPNDKDSDNDELNDGPEIAAFANPLVQDTDGDGLLDGQETNSSPTLSDTDNDSFGDKYEVDHGTPPNDALIFPTQPAGFTLVENFEGAGMTVGQTFSGVNGWFATVPSFATVADEPQAGGGDNVGQLVRTGALGSILRRSLSTSGIQIREGQSGTLFFQVRCTGTTLDQSYGLSDTEAAAVFGDFEAQLTTTGGTLRARDGAVFYDSLVPYLPAAWMNVWIVADNTSDTLRIYYQTASTPQTEIVNVGNAFDFRNGVAANALRSFLVVENAANNPAFIDNIFVDATAENLAIPNGATKPGLGGSDSDNDGLPDIWETTYFGAGNLSQTPGGDFENDGTDNLTEFRLGLIPNSGSSRFVATPSGGGTIQWPSAEGVTFKIERSPSLEVASWSTLEATYPAAAAPASSTSYTDLSPLPGKAFYKVTLNP